MGERGICIPDWKPDSTINQLMDGLEYVLEAPFMKETMDEYSRRRTSERQQDWQKEKETCEDVVHAVHEALMDALREEIRVNTEAILSLDIARRETRTKRYGYSNPLDYSLEERELRSQMGPEGSYRPSAIRNFNGMKPAPQQEKKEEAFFRKQYE